MLGQRHDGLGQGRREQQGAPLGGRGLKNEFQILAKAHVEHFVGFVQHHRLQPRDLQRAPFQMIAQPPRRSHHDMGARGQFAPLASRIHAADAGDHAPAGIMIKPGQFPLHLQRKLAGRRDDQRQRIARRAQGIGAFHQVLGDGHAEGDGFARSGLGRHQKVAALRLFGHHRLLHRGRVFIIAFGQRAGKGRMRRGKSQGTSRVADCALSLVPLAGKDRGDRGACLSSRSAALRPVASPPALRYATGVSPFRRSTGPAHALRAPFVTQPNAPSTPSRPRPARSPR